MINNDIISLLVEHPVLVSYHLKTCMFYVVENTPENLWRPENLLDCVQLCLEYIRQRVVDGICQNYFIPEENLFLGRIHGELQTKLKNVLSSLISSTYHYFPQIKCGNLGALLAHKITGESYSVVPENNLIPDKIRLYLKFAKFIGLVKMRIFCKYSGQKLTECVESHLEDMIKLRVGFDVTEHSKEQINQSTIHVVPYIQLSFMSNIIAYTRSIVKDEEQSKYALLSRSWDELSVRSDQFSAKLKQATFLFKMGVFGASLEILNSLSVACTSTMISICGCGYHHIIVDDETTKAAEKMSEPDFRKKYCMPCVVFLHTELDLIPPVLEYEMKRLSERPSLSSSTQCRFWYDWAVIDSKVLLYCLLYLNHKALTMSPESDEDINMLEYIIENDVNLGHRETGLNILGWIYKKEGNKDKARDCFQRSLQSQRVYNAAKLHMSELAL